MIYVTDVRIGFRGDVPYMSAKAKPFHNFMSRSVHYSPEEHSLGVEYSRIILIVVRAMEKSWPQLFLIDRGRNHIYHS